METIETNWGKIVRWGYNCEDELRDLRKLNDGLSTHHPNYSDFCEKSDKLISECLSLAERLDTICRNAGQPWSAGDVKQYDETVAKYDEAREALDNLCVFEYPNEAHKYGYSYCV